MYLVGDRMFVSVLSDKPELRENFCKLIGKEISKDELAIYSADLPKGKITLIDSIAYPEKIQPLLYSLSMADVVVLLVDGLSPKVGELFVALNSMNIANGIIVSATALPVKGTVLEKYELVADMNAAKEKLLSMPAVVANENLFGFIHKTANIPDLGHVAYGALKGGKIKKGDKLFVLPSRKDLEIRSIHTEEQTHAELSGVSRFDIAYRGDLIERGIIVPLRNDFQMENIVNGRFIKSPFYKDELNPRIHAYSNMQYIEGHISDSDLTFKEQFVFNKGESILILDSSNQKLRIAGVFQSKW